MSQAQQTADRVGAGMFADDAAAHALGITVEGMGPGHACLAMTVRTDMLNSLKICHGGLITTLADAAFAYACNSQNQFTLAASISVDFIAPAREGDQLTAVANEISRTGRTGLYDVTVTNQHGATIAVLRGRCHALKGRQTLPTRESP